MKLQTFFHFALALTASFLLAACGGGGATGNPNAGGPISASPENGTFYAGMPATITLSGGRRPYAITSSEPGILPVPPIVDANSFEVIPNNPGVIDVGLAAGALPVRTVTVSVRDTTGIIVNINIRVAQNFLTGYGLSFGSTTCPAPAGAAPGATTNPCAGGDTVVSLAATFNGSLHGLEAFRFEVVRGQFAFYDPLSSTNTITTSYTALSDHEGKITAVIRVPAGTPSQVAIVRVTHIATGTSTLQVFNISGGSTALTLTAIPATIVFTGANTVTCGSGSADFFVFDGAPPYSAVSSSPNVTVFPPTSASQPGRFTVRVGDCIPPTPIIVTDSLGNRTTVTVSSVRGTLAAPAPVPLTVAPDAIIIACGTSGSVSVVGGTGSYSVTSSHPRVNASVAGNTVTITRLPGPDPTGTFPASANVAVTDGASIGTVAVTFTGTDANGRCPP